MADICFCQGNGMCVENVFRIHIHLVMIKCANAIAVGNVSSQKLEISTMVFHLWGEQGS